MTVLSLDPAGKQYLEIAFPGLGEDAPRAVLSLLAAGDMKLDREGGNPARQGLFASLGIDPSRVLSLGLAHSRRVLAVSDSRDALLLRERALEQGGADGILVSAASFIPALTVADCMPIWLFDARRKVFGLLHSGWKGTGILETAIRRLVAEHDSLPADISVILGPSIGSCCYAVPEERALGFLAEFGRESVRSEVSPEGRITWYLDLRAANRGIAERLGIGKLADLSLCTACSPYLGSFRREGAKDFTRMLALCGYF